MEKSTTLLKKLPLFKYFDEKSLEVVLESSIIKKFKKNDVIIYEGERGNALYIVLSGKVKVSLFSDEEKEMLLSYLKEGDFFGEMGFFGERERSARVVAVEDTECLVLYRDILLSDLLKHPYALLHIVKELIERLKSTDRKLSSLCFLDVSGRIARLLLERAEKEGKIFGDYVFIPHKLKVKDIAKFIGSSRETVSRVLKDMKERGIVKFTSGGILIDKKAFKEEE